jgi:hypothetical protein
MAMSKITDAELLELRTGIEKAKKDKASSLEIQEALMAKGIDLDTSTIRGRFIALGQPLKSALKTGGSTTEKYEIVEDIKPFTGIPDLLKSYIPRAEDFIDYIERPIDKRLMIHLEIGPKTGRYKYPLCQGKQGTGKTYSYFYYAHKRQLPFLLFSCFEDFKLAKLFGDKTIINGSIVFQESIFTRAVASPSIILFDEVNAISNANTFDFHALLQNRELFIKDANDGKGKIFKVHPECRIGFAQNPKSAKYIGGQIRASNFLGRCTFLTYPEFTKGEIKQAIRKRFPNLSKEDLENFTKYYLETVNLIERSPNLPLDISIRQISNVVDLYIHGMPLRFAIEDGLASMTEAASQATAKDAFMKIAEAIWKELMK